MIKDVRGVLENGEARADDVPVNTSTYADILAGEELVIRLYVTTPDNVPLVQSDWIIRLTIRKAISDTFAKAIVLGVSETSQGNGHWTLTVPSDTVRKLMAGSYIFDIWADNATVHYPVVLPSTLYISPAVYRHDES